MKAPAFQFYPRDYLSSQRVALMTLEEEGAYLHALSSCWLHGSIPADPEKLARLIGKGASTILAATVAAMFERKGDVLIHPRLEAEREKQALWKAKSSEGGKKSAAKRKNAENSKGRETTPPTTPPTTLQAPSEGSLKVGSEQNATLQSASASAFAFKNPPPLRVAPQQAQEENRDISAVQEKIHHLFPLSSKHMTSAEQHDLLGALPVFLEFTADDWRTCSEWFNATDEERGRERWPRDRAELIKRAGEAIEKVRAWSAARITHLPVTSRPGRQSAGQLYAAS